MAVHFKFRSAVDYDSIQIDDQFISVANLKDKIIEQKNLGKSLGFNLVIADAQSGEVYDETFLVPRNTSVIIKRVPAARAMSTLQVNESFKPFAEVADTMDQGKKLIPAVQPFSLLKEEIDSMDEFGLDLYAIPEPFHIRSDVDEKTKISSFLTKSTIEWQRQTQDFTDIGRDYAWAGYGRGLGRGRTNLRSTPPPGYVCHRCCQLGHFIQHCPTNGDTTYDLKRVKVPVGIPRTRLKADQEGTYILPDGSVGVMQPDEIAFTKEADAFLSVKSTVTDPPPELRCSLCEEIFKEAVMIPCCHYSFCDTCIRQYLIAKGKCPQCGSVKFKNDDLLPNIALRQAIVRFLDLQDGGVDEANKQKQVSDIDSAFNLEVPAAALSQLQIDLRRPSALNSAPSSVEAMNAKTDMKTVTIAEFSHEKAAVSEAKQASEILKPLNRLADSEINEGHISKEVGNLANAHLPVVKEVSGSVRVQSKKIVIDGFGGGIVSKVSDLSSIKEADGVALESEISKGKRKKKRTRQMPVDGGFEFTGLGKPRKGDRYCFACGSPEHLARDCTASAGPYPFHPGNFPPGGPMPVGVIPPYGSEMFWHGPYMPPPARPFSFGYGDGMYGPSGPAMHFDVPVIPQRPFVPPYMSPFYHGPPMHSHGPYMGSGVPAAVGPAERPLSREEFLELQERERRRRLMQETKERVWVQERSIEKEAVQNATHETSTAELMVCSPSAKKHQSELHKRELDRGSVRNYSDENDFIRNKSEKIIRKRLTERLGDNEANWRPSNLSEDDFSSYDNMKSHKSYTDRLSHSRRSLSFDEKEASRYHKHGSVDNEHDSDLENDVDLCYSVRHQTKKSRDSVHGKHSKYHNRKRVDESRDFVDTTSRGDSHSTCQKSRKRVYDSSKLSNHSESKVVEMVKHIQVRVKEPKGKRDELHDYVVNEYDAWDMSVPKRKQYHSQSKSISDMGLVDHESDDKVKKKKKHFKKQVSSSYETAKEPKIDYAFDALGHSSKHHRHKPKYDQHILEPSLDDSLEDSRWQLESGGCVI